MNNIVIISRDFWYLSTVDKLSLYRNAIFSAQCPIKLIFDDFTDFRWDK